MSEAPKGPLDPLEERRTVPLREILSDARWAFGLARRTAARPLRLLVVAVLVKGLAPAGLAVVFGGLLQAASDVAAGGRGGRRSSGGSSRASSWPWRAAWRESWSATRERASSTS